MFSWFISGLEEAIESAALNVPASIAFFIVFYITSHTAFWVFLSERERRQSTVLLKKLMEKDRSWDPHVIQERVQIILDRVKEARRFGDAEIAKDYVSSHFTEIKPSSIWKADKKELTLDPVKITDCSVVQVSDFIDPARDFFWAEIAGAVQTIDDDAPSSEDFVKVFKFTRNPQMQWVLDSVRASGSEICNFHPFQEDPGRPSGALDGTTGTKGNPSVLPQEAQKHQKCRDETSHEVPIESPVSANIMFYGLPLVFAASLLFVLQIFWAVFPKGGAMLANILLFFLYFLSRFI